MHNILHLTKNIFPLPFLGDKKNSPLKPVIKLFLHYATVVSVAEPEPVFLALSEAGAIIWKQLQLHQQKILKTWKNTLNLANLNQNSKTDSATLTLEINFSKNIGKWCKIIIKMGSVLWSRSRPFWLAPEKGSDNSSVDPNICSENYG